MKQEKIISDQEMKTQKGKWVIEDYLGRRVKKEW
jgi:hypothetical protein